MIVQPGHRGRHRRTSGRRRLWLTLTGAVVVVAAIALTVAGLTGGGPRPERGSGQAAAAAGHRRPGVPAASSPTPANDGPNRGPTSSRPTYAVPRGNASSAAAPTAAPVSVSVPAIGVSSGLQRLGLTGDGTLARPSQWQRAGWYEQSARPGRPGPLVIAGHIDSTSGPAVFYRLHELRAGDAIVVRTAQRSYTYVVDSIARYPKSDFPDAAVYGPTALPTIRLITCTGDFDYRTRNYLDNLVVSGQLRS